MQTTSNSCLSKVHQNKQVGQLCQLQSIKIPSKQDIQMTLTFRPSKLLQKKYIEVTTTFRLSKLIERKYFKRTFLPFEFASNKELQNDVNFSPIESTSSKERRKRVGFLYIEITSKKYVEATWKSLEILFLTHQSNIDIESTSIRRVVSVGIGIP